MRDNVKIEVEEPRPEENGLPVQKQNESITDSTDTVTALQNSVDKMALSMFNALRLFPAKSDSTSDETCSNAINLLAQDVLDAYKQTDRLIDQLPGLDRTEKDQLEEMQMLQIKGEEEAQTLRQVAEEAAIQMAETTLGNITQRYSELRLSDKPCHFLENDDIVAYIEMSQRAVEEMCIECNEKLSPLVSRLEKRTKMIDPVTKAPRFGPRMLEKVNALLRRFDAWKLELETSDVLRDIKSMSLCLRERKLCKLKEEEEQSRLSKLEEARRENELLLMVREEEEEHRRQRISKDEIERQNLTMLARHAQAIREAKARKLEEDALQRDEEFQKLNALKEAVVLGKEGLRQALLTLERSVDDKALYRSKLGKVHKIVSNICSKPERELYRRIDKDNPHFQEDFGKFEGGYHFLLSMGFKEVYDEIESKTMFYLEEPDVNEDMDAWTDWFDSMKDYKIFLEACMSESPPE